jgi:hypothetical protein
MFGMNHEPLQDGVVPRSSQTESGKENSHALINPPLDLKRLCGRPVMKDYALIDKLVVGAFIAADIALVVDIHIALHFYEDDLADTKGHLRS